LPAGKHEIVFKFDTPTLQLTNKLDFASSIVIILLGLGVIVLTFVQKKKETIQDDKA
jgi:MFS-type transporter involved in bile tolerance (Atg22 family)